MLPEISLNILDIAENSARAKATYIEIIIDISSREHLMHVGIKDNGCGMTPEELQAVTDPFFTSRTTRKVGLGIPFLKQSAECTGGTFSIESKKGVGTNVSVTYHTDHIDCMPLGDITETMVTLITSHDEIDFWFAYKVDGEGFQLDTREIKEILGDIPLSEPEVRMFIQEFIAERVEEADKKIDR
ncbi:MAG TPA: ATP-binding protein [Candidatus Eubacterium avistercoris]|uniref:histidine kinase n=1 Tax=Candidatus Eubacterium avistercoris TaxID=2838567 RepID=A0A9D2D140_9FIRM|nr:ATP-binding protein [Candidatus Eubacterium avistercoris]